MLRQLLLIGVANVTPGKFELWGNFGQAKFAPWGKFGHANVARK